jgi:hypothetical protein
MVCFQNWVLGIEPSTPRHSAFGGSYRNALPTPFALLECNARLQRADTVASVTNGGLESRVTLLTNSG